MKKLINTNEMSWSDLIPDVVSTPLKIYKKRHKIQQYWKAFLAKTNLGKTNILILGRSNVGKTVFLDCLNGNANDPFYEKPSTSKDSDNEAIKIGDWHSLFRTAPGQDSLFRDNLLDNAFENTKELEGIIYIVDWGYTYYGNDNTRRKMIKEEGINTIEKLRLFNLDDELDDFSKISEMIKKAFRNDKTIKWLLVVLTKADLFYSKTELEAAEKYYHPIFDDKFGKLLNELSAKVGGDRLKIEAIPFCSFPEDFEWNEEEIKTKIGQKENQNNLIRNFYLKLKELQ